MRLANRGFSPLLLSLLLLLVLLPSKTYAFGAGSMSARIPFDPWFEYGLTERDLKTLPRFP